MNKHPTIGIIGLGAMGAAMARRLMRAGYPVSAWARRPELTHELQSEGLDLKADKSSLFGCIDVLLVNVTTTSDVEGILMGEDGAIHHLAAGSLVIDFSTIDAGRTREIAHALDQRGIRFLDAPVSGGQARAENGTLSIMLGGRADDVEQARPVLEHLGTTITHTGDHGSAQVIKAANQLVMCSTLVGIAEAMAYAKHFGADPQTVVKVISAGLGNSEVLKWAGPKMAAQDYSRVIAARLHAKDLLMVADTANRYQLNMPIAQVVAQRLGELIAQGGGDGDTSAVLQIVEQHLKSV